MARQAQHASDPDGDPAPERLVDAIAEELRRLDGRGDGVDWAEVEGCLARMADEARDAARRSRAGLLMQIARG